MTDRPGASGDADPFLAAALRAYDSRGASALAELYVALLDAEVLVPVIATLLERDPETGGDKRSEMELLTLRAGEREALVVFTGWEQMQAWRPDVRPVPISAVDACGIAIEREYDAVVVDVAGPVTFAIDGDVLVSLADGFQPVVGAAGVSARSSVEVDIRRVASLPEDAVRAVAALGLDVVALEVHDGDEEWRPAIGIVAGPDQPIGAVAQRLAGALTAAIDLVPLTPDQAARLRRSGPA